MNRRERAELESFINIDEFLSINETTVSNIPNMLQYRTDLKTGISQIREISGKLALDASGLTKEIENTKLKLAVSASDVTSKLRAFAKFSGNMPLLEAVSVPESEFKYTSNKKLREYIRGIIEQGQTYIENLASYEVTAETLDKLQALLDAFIGSITKASVAKAAAKQQQVQLGLAFKNAKAALANIDTGVEMLKLKEPKFYVEFKAIKKVTETGIGSLQLKCKVIDSLTKEPVPNVDVVFKLNGNGDALNGNGNITKRTARKGGFYIKSMESGMYQVVLKKNGYAKYKTKVAVNSGEMSKVEVELMKEYE